MDDNFVDVIQFVYTVIPTFCAVSRDIVTISTFCDTDTATFTTLTTAFKPEARTTSLLIKAMATLLTRLG